MSLGYLYLEFYSRKPSTENLRWTFSETSTENYRWALSPNLEEIEDFFKNKHNFILIHMYDSIEKTTKLIRRHFVGRMCYWYPAEEGVTEIFRCEFFENLKVVLASGGKIIFFYVIRLSLPSFLQEKTLNGEFPLDFFSNINGNFPSGNQIDSWLTVGWKNKKMKDILKIGTETW